MPNLSDAIGLLWLPLCISVVLVGIHTALGLHVLRRNIIFVDLALAQIAALGATVAFMLGHAVNSSGSYAYSLLFTLIAAMVLASTRAWSGRISQEALIGVIYVVAAAAAFLLVEKAPQGTEHIKQVLTGNILTAGLDELMVVTPVYAVIGAALWFARARLAQQASGAAGWWWDFFFYVCFGVVVTSSVALAGVLLVFVFLIVPAAIGLLYADGARSLVIGWAVGVVASVAGLALSYAWDLPTGSTMVCVFGVMLALAGALRPLLRGRQALARSVTVLRVVIASVLLSSGIWLCALPRADQPLLDVVERVVPEARALYLTAQERTIHDEAAVYAERYRRQAEQLNAREAASRWQGAALDDNEVRRISSFLKSYNEMRKGEEFVQREVRSRARTRNRWVLGLALVLCSALIAPWPWWRWIGRQHTGDGQERGRTAGLG